MSKSRVALANPILEARNKFLTNGVESPASPPDAAPEIAPLRHPVASDALLTRYLAAEEKNINDMMYLPPELYDVLMTVWHTRKRTKRGVKKSHLLIEALLQHPEIVAELRLRGILA